MICFTQNDDTMNKSEHHHPIMKMGLIWLLLALVSLVAMFICFLIPTKYTQTNDIADYGAFTGTNSDSFTQRFISSFFPAELDSSFEVISYSYRAEDNDSYGFEAYLEFRIDDADRFDEYIQTLAVYGEPAKFIYDPSFFEYSIEDRFDLTSISLDQSTNTYPIECARIKKILYSTETQTIIYVAMGVYDGGGVDTDYFSAFFDRFGIDPRKYEELSDSPYGHDPYRIE